MKGRIFKKIALALVMGLSATTYISGSAYAQDASGYETGEKEIVYFLGEPAKRYVTAQDAMDGVNSVGTYEPGKYYTYTVDSNGALNISKVEGQPGSWINPFASPAPDEDKEIVFILDQPAQRYGTAQDAMDGVNSVGTYEPGTYYTYSLADNGAVNISTVEGIPGSWINPYALSQDKDAVGSLINLQPNEPYFLSREDAEEGINPQDELNSGIYVILEKMEGAMLIAPDRDSNGFWIKYSSSYRPFTSVDTAAEDVLETPVDIYVYASDEDARAGIPSGTYPKGFYFITHIGDGVIRIATERGVYGVWTNDMR